MAESITRIVPPSVSFDRTTARDRQKKDAEKRKQNPESNAPVPAGQSEEPAKEPADSEQDKGKHLDISA